MKRKMLTVTLLIALCTFMFSLKNRFANSSDVISHGQSAITAPNLKKQAPTYASYDGSVQNSLSRPQQIVRKKDSQTSVMNIVQALTLGLYNSKGNYADREYKLRLLVSKVSPSEWVAFADSFVRGSLSSDEKRSGLYILGLADANGIQGLSKIASSPFLPGISEQEKNFEFSLRISALEKLDLLGKTSKEAQSELLRVSKIQSNKALRVFSEIALMGIQQGKPGKLHRLIEKTLINFEGKSI